MPDTGSPTPATPSVLGVLRTPRWLLFGLLAIVLAVVMVFLGIWQLHRYQLRTSINNRIDQHAAAAPVAGTDRILPAGRSPSADDEYLRVRLTGRYDPAHQMLARVRTVDGNVGYEILTPLRRTDGTAVLVDRGWLPPADPDGAADPVVPAAPRGEVTVVGQVRLPESSGSTPTRRNGHVEVRRIDPRLLASALPYPIAGGYVTATSQTPPLSGRFVPIPIDHQNAAMNLSYILQWWLFSGMALVGFVLLMRWEARKRAGLSAPGDRPDGSRSPGSAPGNRSRLPEDAPSRRPEDSPRGAQPYRRSRSESRLPEDRPRGESRLPEDRPHARDEPRLPEDQPHGHGESLPENQPHGHGESRLAEGRPRAGRGGPRPPAGGRRSRNESRLPEDNVAVPDRSSRLPEDQPGTG